MALAGLLAVGCSASTTVPVLPATQSPSAPAGTVGTATATPSASASTRPASATPTPSAPVLEVSSVANFRDVAGAGLPLPDGDHMVTGLVYRSAKLSTASRADVARLAKAGIGLVIDLRTDAVAARTPDPAIRGADYELVNIYAAYSTPPARPKSVADARAYMRDMNIRFVSVPAQRAKVAEAEELIADAKRPVVVHCTEGKDRTGWISAMLQLVAGADRDQVMAEYLKSNEYREDFLASSYRSTLASKGRTAAEIQQAQYRVRPEYLNAGLAEMDGRFGGLDGYLTEGLGLSRATIDALRERLTA